MPKKALPKTVGGLADAYYKQEQVIKAINAEFNAKLKKEKEYLSELEAHAFKMFKNQDMEGAKGKTAQLSISTSQVPTVEDPANWEAVFKWILKKKDFAILQRRLAVTHIRDLWDQKVAIPGVGVFTKVSLSSTKIKANAKKK